MEASISAVMQELFTRPRFSTGVQPSHQFKCRQCTDIADYFVETGPNFRFRVWESYENLFQSLDESKASTSSSPNISTVPSSFPLQAMQQFCRAVKEAEAFCQDHCCTSTGRHDWMLCANGLSQLDTNEAYDVHLHNMIWSQTGLEIALLYYYAAAVAANTKSGPGSNHPYRAHEHLSEHVQMLVADSKTILRRYSSAYKERQTFMDRFDFNDLIGNCIKANGNGSGVDKYLSFLLSVSKNAEQQLSDQVLDIDGLEISEEDTVNFSKEEETIGEGGYSKRVCRTWWLDGKMAVAVKVISLEYYSAYDSDEELAGELAELQESDEGDPAEKNFKDEVSLLASLQSPYIVRLLGWAIDKKRKEGKLVTELVATDLGKVLEAPENRKGLAFDVALDLMLQLSKALEYLHAQNVIHRDIKPSNILLQPILGSAHSTSSRDQFWRVKLCDFGIAKKKLPQGAMSSARYMLELTLDGCAVICGAKGAPGVVWATERKSMSSGDVLFPNHGLRNNGYHFIMQNDGNLVLYDEQRHAQWASGTNSRDNEKRCRCTLQSDGILVVLKGDSDVVWTSKNQPCSNPTLELQSNGNVIITDNSGRVAWETSTGRTEDFFMMNNAAYY